MNAEQILKALFPQATEYRTHEMEGRCSGLDKNVLPKDCEILGRFNAPTHTLGKQEHFLVKMESGLYVYLRICDAMKGSGYDKFAVLLDTYENAKEATERFEMKRKYLS